MIIEYLLINPIDIHFMFTYVFYSYQYYLLISPAKTDGSDIYILPLKSFILFTNLKINQNYFSTTKSL